MDNREGLVSSVGDALRPTEPLEVVGLWRTIGLELRGKRRQALSEMTDVKVEKPLDKYTLPEISQLSEAQKIKLLLETFDPAVTTEAIRDKVPNIGDLSKNAAQILVDLALSNIDTPGDLTGLLHKYTLPELMAYHIAQYTRYETYSYSSDKDFHRIAGVARKYMEDERLGDIFDSEKLAQIMRNEQGPAEVGREISFLANMGVVNPKVDDRYLRSVLPDKAIKSERFMMSHLAFIYDLFYSSEKAPVQMMEYLYELEKTDRDRFFQRTSLQNNIAPLLEYIANCNPEERRWKQNLHYLGGFITNNKISPPLEQRAALVDLILSTKKEDAEKGRHVTFYSKQEAREEAITCLEYCREAWPSFMGRFSESMDNKDIRIDRLRYQEYLEELRRKTLHARQRAEKMRQQNIALEMTTALADFSQTDESRGLIEAVKATLGACAPGESKTVPKDFESSYRRSLLYPDDHTSHNARVSEFQDILSGTPQLLDSGSIERMGFPSIYGIEKLREMQSFIQDIAGLKREGRSIPTLDILSLTLEDDFCKPGKAFCEAFEKWQQSSDPRFIKLVFERTTTAVARCMDWLLPVLEKYPQLFPQAKALKEHLLSLSQKVDGLDYHKWKQSIIGACQAQAADIADLSEFGQLLCLAEVCASIIKVNQAGEYIFDDAIDPGLVQKVVQYGFEKSTREQVVFSDIYYQVPVGQFSISPAELMLLSGQAGAGKTTFVDALYHSVEAAALVYPPDARGIDIPIFLQSENSTLPACAFRVARSGTDYDNSLFEVNVANLRSVTEGQIFHLPRDFPFMIIIDEGLVGTESWRRTLLASAYCMVLKRYFPNVRPLVVTHENEIVFRIYTALGQESGLFVRPVAINPENHKPMEGLTSGGGLETTSWVGLEQGVQMRAEKLELALAAGNPLDLTAFREASLPERGEAQEEKVGISNETLRELGIRAGDISEGFFAFIYETLKKQELFQHSEIAPFIRQFSHILVEVTQGEREKIATYQAQAAKMMRTGEGTIASCAQGLVRSAQTLEYFFSKLNDENIVDFLKATSSENQLSQAFSAPQKYLRFLNVDATRYQASLEAFLPERERIRSAVKKAYIGEVARQFIRSSCDLKDLVSDLSLTEESKAMGQTYARNFDSLSAELREKLKQASDSDKVDELLTSFITAGDWQSLSSVLTVYTPAEVTSKTDAATLSQDELLSLLVIPPGGITDARVALIQKEVATRNKQRLQFDTRIDLPSIVGEAQRENFSVLTDSLKQLTFATISAILQGKAGEVGIKTGIAERTIKKGQFPIAMQKATDPALRYAVEAKGKKYVEQDFQLPDSDLDVVILNGPNKSSKTKIAQNMGVQIWASRVLGFSFAERLQLSEDIDDYSLIVSINPESEYKEDSTFTAQARHMQSIAYQILENFRLGRKSLVIIDEPFNGIGARDKAILIAAFTDWTSQFGTKIVFTNHETMVYQLLGGINQAYQTNRQAGVRYLPVAMDRNTFQVKDYGHIAPSEPYDIFLDVYKNSPFAREVVATAKTLENLDLAIQEHLKKAKAW